MSVLTASFVAARRHPAVPGRGREPPGAGAGAGLPPRLRAGEVGARPHPGYGAARGLQEEGHGHGQGPRGCRGQH